MVSSGSRVQQGPWCHFPRHSSRNILNLIYNHGACAQNAIPFLIGTKFDQFATFPRDEQEEITKQVRPSHCSNFKPRSPLEVFSNPSPFFGHTTPPIMHHGIMASKPKLTNSHFSHTYTGQTFRQSHARVSHLLFNLSLHQRPKDLQNRARKGV
jgi:hypothetical protein